MDARIDFSEPTKIVYNRIRQLEPENVTKIMGYLLLQDNNKQEMVHWARSSDKVLHQLIHQTKQNLINYQQTNRISTPATMTMTSPEFSSSPEFHPPLSSGGFRPTYFHWEPYVVARTNGSVCFDYNQVNSSNSGSLSHYYYQNVGSSGPTGQGSSNTNQYPVKTCHYFNRGFCKHGNNCRYLHKQSSDPFFGDDEQVFTPGSLDRLEFEIAALLKSRRGQPVSIASLPMLYFDTYRKVLQAEGYLTESQRHGKAGYSLTKLLARLKHRIRLIDRPHGQHAVILIEDASKYIDNRIYRNDPGPIVIGSRQIYLTFPAESNFTEDDVADHFNTFGPVEDVRIPCQQDRMFGFVTFATSDTVKMILSKGNPHFVRGARVLVKPYREKSKFDNRKYHERIEIPTYYYPPHFVNVDDSEFRSIPKVYDHFEFVKTQQQQQLIEHQRQVFEFERKHMKEMQLSHQQTQPDHSFFVYPLDGSSGSNKSNEDPEDQQDFRLEERFNHVFDILNDEGPDFPKN